MTILNHNKEQKQRLETCKTEICKTTLALFSDSLDLNEDTIQELVFAHMNYLKCVTSEHIENDSINDFVSECNHMRLSLPKVKNYYDEFIVGMTQNEFDEADDMESQKNDDYNRLVHG